MRLEASSDDSPPVFRRVESLRTKRHVVVSHRKKDLHGFSHMANLTITSLIHQWQAVIILAGFIYLSLVLHSDCQWKHCVHHYRHFTKSLTIECVLSVLH